MVTAEETLPENAIIRPGAPVLAWGEVTGHSHRIEDSSAVTFYKVDEGEFFVVHADSTRLIHEEHGPITLPRGVYRFWHQREYSTQAIRRVID